MNEIITSTGVAAATITEKGELVFRDGTADKEWFEVHRQLRFAKKHAGRLVKESLDYGSTNYGAEYAGKADAQILFDLGDGYIEPPEGMNPKDKSRAIVTIESIAMSFSLWHRKMEGEVAGWDRPRVEAALRLIEPIARLAAELRAKLEGGE
jgi:hypothetical protein